MHTSVRQIIAIYCLCDDFLLARGYKDAPQAKLTTAEVMTVALVASALFNSNQERSRVFLRDHSYIKNMLSKGCFNRVDDRRCLRRADFAPVPKISAPGGKPGRAASTPSGFSLYSQRK